MTFGVFKGSRLVCRGYVPTALAKQPRHLLSGFRNAFRRFEVPLKSIDGAIVSSVVPFATAPLKAALFKTTGIRPLVVGKELQAPVINRYRIPSQVGQDRLVNAAAACELYGGPAIVVDFGTAITIDLVTAKREYLGGIILPGMEIALEALSSRAALLPKIRLVPPKELLGRDTVGSMRAGIFYGYGVLCDGLIRLLKKRYIRRAKVIGTGGNIPLIAPYCREIGIVKGDLTLVGLEITYRKYLTIPKKFV